VVKTLGLRAKGKPVGEQQGHKSEENSFTYQYPELGIAVKHPAPE